LCADIAVEQEDLWRDTLEENEAEIRRGGLRPTNVDPKLYHDLQVLVSRLVGKASQLLGNHTTNLAEGWMNIRSKFDGGKVINRSQSGSWEHRCMGAGLQQNGGREWGAQAWKSMTTCSPNTVFINTARRASLTVSKNKKRKATERAKESRRRSKYARTDNSATARSAYSRHDGGISPEDILEDISPQHLEELKYTFYETKVTINREEASRIERETREQAQNEKWKEERRKRITASNVGGIAKMKATTKRSTKVRNLLYSTFRGNKATLYGSQMEEPTRVQYTTHQQRNGHPNLTVEQCGLFISEQNNWLAATPDGKVHDPGNISEPFGLLEIKNPFSVRDKDLTEACVASSFCLEHDKKNSTRRLKRRHDYYFQVQCQLYCTDLPWCDFVVRTDKDIHIERIHRDAKWWGCQLAKCRKFYFSALLPELACPRQGCGGIREPN
jgi:hypothetical protein